MKDSKQLLKQIEQGTAPSQKTLATEAGQADTGSAAQAPKVSEQHIDAINQVFALFRINYHNQYHSAFSDTQLLNQAKKLWAETLQRFPAEAILRGAKQAIEESEYLPTLHKMIGFCQGSPSSHGLPDVHSAYLEACQAPSPKSEYRWSHPAVYYAGRDSDWFFLANNPERDTFPIFRQHYSSVCERVIKGEVLPAPEIKKLPENPETPLSRDENLERMARLRDELGI